MLGMLDEGDRVKRYAAAALIVATTFVIRFTLHAEFGLERAPFVMLYPMVGVVAYFCGFGPGLVALGVGFIFGTYWSHVAYLAGDTIQRVLVFEGVWLGTSIITLLITRELQNGIMALKNQVSAIGHTNSEMRHRVKNILTVANAIASKTIRSSHDADAAAQAISGRFIALGAVYDVLPENNGHASLHDLMDRLVYPLTPDGSRYQVTGDHVMIPAHVATTFGLVLHELATNALKHGAWKTNDGKVSVGWVKESDNKLWFQWCERCGAEQCLAIGNATFVEGTGLKLITRALPEANVSVEMSHDGARCTIVMPLDV